MILYLTREPKEVLFFGMTPTQEGSYYSVFIKKPKKDDLPDTHFLMCDDFAKAAGIYLKPGKGPIPIEVKRKR